MYKTCCENPILSLIYYFLTTTIFAGESKEYIDFAKQFLERRSKYKNLQRAQNAHDDDLCKPALAITPSVNDNGDNKVCDKSDFISSNSAGYFILF